VTLDAGRNRGQLAVIEHQPVTPTSGQRTIVRLVRRRLRVARVAVWLRAGGIQFAWLMILGAGAAIPCGSSAGPRKRLSLSTGCVENSLANSAC
jgi:hypothetical protein